MKVSFKKNGCFCGISVSQTQLVQEENTAGKVENDVGKNAGSIFSLFHNVFKSPFSEGCLNFMIVL